MSLTAAGGFVVFLLSVKGTVRLHLKRNSEGGFFLGNKIFLSVMLCNLVYSCTARQSFFKLRA